MIPIPARVAFLRRIHLFHDLTEEDLTPVAAKLTERTCPPGEQVFAQGSAADQFFMVVSGKVHLMEINKAHLEELATFVAGDYFGEEGLLFNQKRTASLVAAEETEMFVLSQKDFAELVKTYPDLKPSFLVSIKSRRLARRIRFKWLEEGEIVYFLARKHYILLLQAMLGPALAALLSIFVLAWALLTGATFSLWIGIALVLGALGWAVWDVIDWGNDYYIVTNQRAIWLEKVVGIYDSRQETPLSSVLSVGVETDMTGRLLDYGNVIVRSFVGKLAFSHVSHPYQAAHMIEEHWNRLKSRSSQEEKEAMKDAIRQKLGLTSEVKVQPPAGPEKESPPHLYRVPWLRLVAGNLFRIRYEDSGTITYRKHWFVLVQQLWKPSFFVLLLSGFMASRLLTLARTAGKSVIHRTQAGGLALDTILVSLPILLIPFALWWVYEYMDWSNDIFQVTSDQILDIDRKPFGTEERRAAPLESILATEYRRIGVLGNLLNFGTVYISVGGSQLAFEDVLDPPSVQADIDRRRIASRAKKAQAQTAAERERMADWLATYHRSADEFRALPDLPDLTESEPKSE